MKKIPLTQGKFAIVDDEDYHYLSRFKWHIANDGMNHVFPVRVICSLKNGVPDYHMKMVDMIIARVNKKHILHKNHNNLDCRKENLIYGNWSHSRHNQINSNKKLKSSKYIGVSVKKGVTGKNGGYPYRTMIQKDGIKYSNGYKTEKEAVLAYNKKAKELYGEYAYQNKI